MSDSALAQKVPPRTRSKRTLSREDWVKAARTALIGNGIDGTKVDLLAKKLKVTRGSFYWHFEDRAELLRVLLQHWEETNNTPVLDAIRAAGERGERADFDTHVGRLWMDEKAYSPAFDSAVRDWARKEPRAALAVHRVDDQRIEAFRQMFEAYGFKGAEALVRARITYFHQVGYYTLEIQESLEDRERLGSLYDQVLLY